MSTKLQVVQESQPVQQVPVKEQIYTPWKTPSTN
jgi:hypothetical protein